MTESQWLTEFELCKRGIGYAAQEQGRRSGRLKAKKVGNDYTYRSEDVDRWILGEAVAANARRTAQASATATAAPRAMHYESLTAAQFAQRCAEPAAVTMSLDEARATTELLDRALELTPDRRDPIAMVDQLAAAIQKDTGCGEAAARVQVFKNHEQLRLDYVRAYNERARSR